MHQTCIYIVTQRPPGRIRGTVRQLPKWSKVPVCIKLEGSELGVISLDNSSFIMHGMSTLASPARMTAVIVYDVRIALCWAPQHLHA